MGHREGGGGRRQGDRLGHGRQTRVLRIPAAHSTHRSQTPDLPQDSPGEQGRGGGLRPGHVRREGPGRRRGIQTYVLRLHTFRARFPRGPHHRCRALPCHQMGVRHDLRRQQVRVRYREDQGRDICPGGTVRRHGGRKRDRGSVVRPLQIHQHGGAAEIPAALVPYAPCPQDHRTRPFDARGGFRAPERYRQGRIRPHGLFRLLQRPVP